MRVCVSQCVCLRVCACVSGHAQAPCRRPAARAPTRAPRGKRQDKVATARQAGKRREHERHKGGASSATRSFCILSHTINNMIIMCESEPEEALCVCVCDRV